jgi:hypothetical protein
MIRSKTKTLVVPVLGLLRPVNVVKPNTKAVGRRRRRPALVGLGAVGVALVVAGCGSAASTTSTPAQTPVAPAAAVHTPTAAPAKAPAPTTTPAATATPTPKATPTAPAAPAAKNPDAGIPQGNGGDSDPDNNGGPNDGDGPI